MTGKDLKIIMQRLGFKQTYIAQKLGTSQANISAMYNRMQVGAAIIKDLQEKLNIDLAEFGNITPEASEPEPESYIKEKPIKGKNKDNSLVNNNLGGSSNQITMDSFLMDFLMNQQRIQEKNADAILLANRTNDRLTSLLMDGFTAAKQKAG